MIHAGELLSAYLDGELSSTEQDDLVAHLGSCSQCREELADLDSARTAVRSLPMLDPPAALVPTPIGSAPSKRKRRGRVAAAAAVAAAAVISFGIVRGGEPPATVNFEGAIDQHMARVSLDPGVASVKVVSVVNP